MTRDRRRTTTGDRGQTPLDFAVGVSVFLLTAIFVLTFVPGMLEPFEESTQEEISAADRIATELVEETLASPDRPHLLDRECTVIFFESRAVADEDPSNDTYADDWENIDGDGVFAEPFGTGTYPGDCNFDDISLEERLALTSTTDAALNARVRLVRNLTDGGPDGVNTLCVNADDGNSIIEADNAPFDGSGDCDLNDGSDDVLFEIGPTPPSSSDSVVVARRFVRVEGKFHDGTSDAMLVVEVW